jgi:hypothetical protein
MTAAACLQILIAPELIAAHGDVRAAVARVTNAFLEAQWSWPKRYVEMCPTSYMLTAPQSKVLDFEGVQRISTELQTRLFGQDENSDVEIAVFEGSQADAMRFAALSADEVMKLLDEASEETFGLRGRLIRVRSDSVEAVRELHADINLEIRDSGAPQLPTRRITFRGMYLTAKQQFVCSIASRWSAKDSGLQSILNGPAHYPHDQESFDRETIEALVEAYPNGVGALGVIHLPLSYTNLTRRGSLARYAEHLASLQDWGRHLLVAEIYDAPRMPNHVALIEASTLIMQYCGAMDLMITDPETDLLGLKPGLLRSITLAAPNGEEPLRETAIRRFLARKNDFREKKVWPIVGNVRTRREMQVCNSSGGLLMHGPGVTAISEAPVAVERFPLASLPLTVEGPKRPAPALYSELKAAPEPAAATAG